MKVLDAGHHYELASLDGECRQTLTFVKRCGDHYPGNVDAYPGTTTQDVLRCLIDRAEYVNDQIPCAETQAAKALMETALFLLEVRAARVKGRHLDLPLLAALRSKDACAQCGHVECVIHSPLSPRP